MCERLGIYVLTGEFDRKRYSRLLDLAVRWGGSFILVRRKGLLAQGDQFLRSLSPYQIGIYRGAAWPGTRLIGGATVEVSKFCITADSIEVLRKGPHSLWDWLEPSYPEDLSFLRPSGQPWFVSITHENDAFFKAVQAERAMIEESMDEPLVFQCEDQCPDETY